MLNEHISSEHDLNNKSIAMLTESGRRINQSFLHRKKEVLPLIKKCEGKKERGHRRSYRKRGGEKKLG